ncbi:hypothetical protein AVEN_262641-1 [Araneus ventricosus]|uniref:DNA helicase Pif1-like 2B domain-containing protein n=1 Tax=Araneus ventricosus TaxID=182803 RepID=A0A4Y2NX84_ARAVE|nr:hypothetical protein AVEN_262641-1 [Araneus ventricosus]
MRVHLKSDIKAEEFSKLLLNIGDGKLLEEGGKVHIPRNLCDLVHDLNSLTEVIYPALNEKGIQCTSWLRERAILTPTNGLAMNINNKLLEKLPSKILKYESIDSVVEAEEAIRYSVKFLHTLNPPRMPPRLLYLKIGAPIMLLRNLNQPKLCDSTRFYMKTLYKYVIEATIFTGVGQGESAFIPRIPSYYPFQFKRLQFPVKVCYAIPSTKLKGKV